MARYKYQGTFKDGNGRVVGTATTSDGVAGTISVYEAGGTTAASVYAASAGGVAVNSVSTDTHGYFYFWVDDGDYAVTQRFKIILSHADFESKTYDNIRILNHLDSVIATATEINTACDGITATAAELNQCDGVGLLVGDATVGRVLRSSVLTIDNATTADEIKCTFGARWNGDAIAETDDIGKGELVGDFRLGASGSVITIEATGLTGDCVAVLSADIYENKTGSAILIKAMHSADDIRVEILDSLLGTAEDMTVLVDTGRLQLSIAYITSA